MMVKNKYSMMKTNDRHKTLDSFCKYQQNRFNQAEYNQHYVKRKSPYKKQIQQITNLNQKLENNNNNNINKSYTDVKVQQIKKKYQTFFIHYDHKNGKQNHIQMKNNHIFKDNNHQTNYQDNHSNNYQNKNFNKNSNNVNDYSIIDNRLSRFYQNSNENIKHSRHYTVSDNFSSLRKSRDRQPLREKSYSSILKQSRNQRQSRIVKNVHTNIYKTSKQKQQNNIIDIDQNNKGNLTFNVKQIKKNGLYNERSILSENKHNNINQNCQNNKKDRQDYKKNRQDYEKDGVNKIQLKMTQNIVKTSNNKDMIVTTNNNRDNTNTVQMRKVKSNWKQFLTANFDPRIQNINKINNRIKSALGNFNIHQTNLNTITVNNIDIHNNNLPDNAYNYMNYNSNSNNNKKKQDEKYNKQNNYHSDFILQSSKIPISVSRCNDIQENSNLLEQTRILQKTKFHYPIQVQLKKDKYSSLNHNQKTYNFNNSNNKKVIQVSSEADQGDYISVKKKNNQGIKNNQIAKNNNQHQKQLKLLKQLNKQKGFEQKISNIQVRINDLQKQKKKLNIQFRPFSYQKSTSYSQKQYNTISHNDSKYNTISHNEGKYKTINAMDHNDSKLKSMNNNDIKHNDSKFNSINNKYMDRNYSSINSSTFRNNSLSLTGDKLKQIKGKYCYRPSNQQTQFNKSTVRYHQNIIDKCKLNNVNLNVNTHKSKYDAIETKNKLEINDNINKSSIINNNTHQHNNKYDNKISYINKQVNPSPIRPKFKLIDILQNKSQQVQEQLNEQYDNIQQISKFTMKNNQNKSMDQLIKLTRSGIQIRKQSLQDKLINKFSKQQVFKKLQKYFQKQIQLDDKLRKAKLWFMYLKKQDKYQTIYNLMQQKYGIINKQLKKILNLKSIKNQFRIMDEQIDPFYSVRTLQSTFQQLVEYYCEAENNWVGTIVNSNIMGQLIDFKWVKCIDLENKQFADMNDLVRFMNFGQDSYYRVSDIVLIYKRLFGGQIQIDNIRCFKLTNDVLERINKAVC